MQRMDEAEVAAVWMQTSGSAPRAKQKKNSKNSSNEPA